MMVSLKLSQLFMRDWVSCDRRSVSYLLEVLLAICSPQRVYMAYKIFDKDSSKWLQSVVNFAGKFIRLPESVSFWPGWCTHICRVIALELQENLLDCWKVELLPLNYCTGVVWAHFQASEVIECSRIFQSWYINWPKWASRIVRTLLIYTLAPSGSVVKDSLQPWHVSGTKLYYVIYVEQHLQL